MAKRRHSIMMSEIKQVFVEKKYLTILLTISAVSFILFLLLTFIFPWSSFLFFNYFLKEAVNYTIMTFIIAAGFSLIFGLASSVIAYNFKAFIGKRMLLFLGVAIAFYIISYILTLINTSYSLFSYTEMNGVLYTFASFSSLAIILPLSSLLVVNAYTLIRNVNSIISGAGGLAAGIFSMGCPTCGALLLSLVGVTVGLAILPLRGLEVKLLSIGLLGFATYKLTNSKACSTRASKIIDLGIESLFSKRFENIMLVLMILTAGIISFNQMQISDISSSFDAVTGVATGRGVFLSSGESDLSGADVSQVTSTAMAIAIVFPELKDAKNEQDVMNVMIPSGTPEYSEALGGITFDDPVNSLNYLARWYYDLKDEVKQNDPQTWQRYLSLAAAPRGISCEFCCGVGPQGITANGDLRCGCQHSPAIQAVTLGLMRYTDYSDAQVLREVMKWKTIWFPKNMITLGVQVVGQDPSQLKDLPGMVGGC